MINCFFVVYPRFTIRYLVKKWFTTVRVVVWTTRLFFKEREPQVKSAALFNQIQVQKKTSVSVSLPWRPKEVGNALVGGK